jgi:phenylacetic acid degradation operon negative regulatory protein
MAHASPLLGTLARTGAPRIASLIVTVWGDAVAPRGGSLWLGSLQAILDRFGCTPGQVRTAMSRLTEEGWLARNRVGRNSFYRLGPRGEASFAAAAARIYAGRPRDWDGRFRLVPFAEPAAREALSADGFGALPGGAMLGVSGDPALLPRGVPVLLGAARSPAEARRGPPAPAAGPLGPLWPLPRAFARSATARSRRRRRCRCACCCHEWRRVCCATRLPPRCCPRLARHRGARAGSPRLPPPDPGRRGLADAGGRNERRPPPPSPPAPGGRVTISHERTFP